MVKPALWNDVSASAAKNASFEDVTPERRSSPLWLRRSRPPKRSTAPPPAHQSLLPPDFLATMQREIESMIPEPMSPLEALVSGSIHPSPLEPDPDMLRAFSDALVALASARDEIVAHTSRQLAELAATIARRVIARELSLRPNVVHDLVREALEGLGRHDRVVVRVGTGFAAALPALEERLSGKQFEVYVEPDLDEFGCFVQTEYGEVDESIENRLSTLLTALTPDSSPPEA
jgi:hypothetical protein